MMETVRQTGQTRTIAEGLPSTSFHGINTIIALAKAPFGAPLDTISGWPPSPLTQSQPRLEEKPVLSRQMAAFCYWPVNESERIKKDIVQP